MHLWRLDEWRSLLPQAEFWGPPSLANSPHRRAFAGILGDKPPHEWQDDLDQVVFSGNAVLREVEFLHKPSRTLIFGDFVQNYPPEESRPLATALRRLAGVSGPGVPIDIRLTFFNKKLGRLALAKMLSWDFDRLVLAHGASLDHDAKPLVCRAFAWLAA